MSRKKKKKKKVWKPLPKQALALECPAFELLYGGSKGGGRTFDVGAVEAAAISAAEAPLAEPEKP